MYKCAALFCTCLVIAACGGSSGKARKYQAPTAAGIVAELQGRQALTKSFLAESRMEYWVKDQRVKATVYVMGEMGARVRFNALNPTGGGVAADLACDGDDFAFVDFNKNCQLSGPCTREAIAQLLRVSLAPDDFLMLAAGSTPIIAFDEGKVTWDSKNARETVELTTNDGSLRQKIILDGRERRWDVLSSTVWGAGGEIDWKLTNKEFSNQKTEDGDPIRLPQKTRFEQPEEKADLTIRWDERSINGERDPDKYVMQLPDLPSC
ncbi:MAG: hypothetical protein GY811_01445 [Myxococcales bacterium]|nr:hypothetical protein [Myxococcales bacterium]